MKRLAAALQFLTIFPVRGSTASPGQAAVFFPVVGVMLGALGGAVHRAAGPLWAIAFLIVATGGLHEDGLADSADAFRAGRSRDKILSILKDSRIGTYGALALIVTIAIRWQSLAQIQVPAIAGLSGALALSRGAMVLLAGSTPAAGEGLGKLFASELSRVTLCLVAAQAVVFSLLSGWRHAALLLAVTGLTTLAARTYFVRRAGGVTGDCLGATCQLVETANLVTLAWHPFF